MNLTRTYLATILVFLTHHLHAQETDVQRAELKGPVKYYSYKDDLSHSWLKKTPYRYACYFNKQGMKTIDTTYNDHRYRNTKYDNYWLSVHHYFYSNSDSWSKGYTLEGTDTVYNSTTNTINNGSGQIIVTLDCTYKAPGYKKYGAVDTAIIRNSFTYYPDGKLKEIARQYGKDIGREYGSKTEFIYKMRKEESSVLDYDKEKGKWITAINSVELYDEEGELIKETTWLYGKDKESTYYIYFDDKDISKRLVQKGIFNKGTYFVKWDKDRYGNYLKSATYYKGEFGNITERTIIYY